MDLCPSQVDEPSRVGVRLWVDDEQLGEKVTGMSPVCPGHWTFSLTPLLLPQPINKV